MRPAPKSFSLFDGQYDVSGQSEHKEPVLRHEHHTFNPYKRGHAEGCATARRGLAAALATAGAKSVATPPREFL